MAYAFSSLDKPSLRPASPRAVKRGTGHPGYSGPGCPLGACRAILAPRVGCLASCRAPDPWLSGGEWRGCKLTWHWRTLDEDRPVEGSCSDCYVCVNNSVALLTTGAVVEHDRLLNIRTVIFEFRWGQMLIFEQAERV